MVTKMFFANIFQERIIFMTWIITDNFKDNFSFYLTLLA